MLAAAAAEVHAVVWRLQADWAFKADASFDTDDEDAEQRACVDYRLTREYVSALKVYKEDVRKR
jgi:hypothetical protein